MYKYEFTMERVRFDGTLSNLETKQFKTFSEGLEYLNEAQENDVFLSSVEDNLTVSELYTYINRDGNGYSMYYYAEYWTDEWKEEIEDKYVMTLTVSNV